MKLKHWSKIFHVIQNENSIVLHVIHIRNGVMINVNVRVKSIAREENIKVGMLAHVFVSTVSICKVLSMVQMIQ